MVAQAHIHTGGPALKPVRTPQARPRIAVPAPAPGRTADTLCEACQGSGEIWLLDRHAGAVWMPCGCGVSRDGAASASWLAIFVYPCVAAGVCASMFFLL